MTTLQKIVKEAKRLKKLHPNKFPKWTDYVKAASKNIKSSKKVGSVKKKIAPKKKPATKKAKTKFVKPRKKATPRHKDIKSHNVNIKVVSGISKNSRFHIDMISRTLKQIERYQRIIDEAKEILKTPHGKANKSYYVNEQKEAKKNIMLLKKNLTLHKKSIK
jgi:hypothetical protein